MSDKEKIIASLEKKGLLDESSVRKLRARLKNKLKLEASIQDEEIVSLRTELSMLQNRVSG